MKLVMVLMLSALPLYCYAGSGCVVLEEIIHDTISPDVSMSDYMEELKPFMHTKLTENAVKEFKECFLKQSNETLANVQVMMETIYKSKYCKYN